MPRRATPGDAVQVARFLVDRIEKPEERGRLTERLAEIERLPLAAREHDAALVYQDAFRFLLHASDTEDDDLLRQQIRNAFHKKPIPFLALLAYERPEQFRALATAFLDDLLLRATPLLGVALPPPKTDDLPRAIRGLIQRLDQSLGAHAASRIVEASFVSIVLPRTYLPTAWDLVGLLPDGLLCQVRAQRLRDLETVADQTARELASANQRLIEHTQRLTQSVEDLRSANARLETAGEARTNFIRVVSHQFRTPLSGIRWNLDSLEDAVKPLKPSREVLESLQGIRELDRFLISTLDHVLLALEIDTGTFKVERKPHFFWEIVQDVIEEEEPRATARRLTLSFKKDAGTLRTIPLDAELMRSVVYTLLDNAINYTPPGGEIRVQLLTSRRTTPSLVLRVVDTGIGIRASDQERIFDKFFRGSNAQKMAANGTGLGMHLAKVIAEAHGGEISLQSTEGRGTTISLTLPIESKE